ncbi:MAG: 4-hydroxy-tetrahydrodipicolinate synthase [Myxococcota bacterium]
MLKLTGAMTAIITPFTADGAIDETALRDLVERQIEGSIDGLVAAGTTGEAATMTQDEKYRTIAIVADQAKGRVPVVANTGNNDTRQSVRLTTEVLDSIGGKLDAIMAVCPYYNKPDQTGLVAHFEAMANIGKPLVVYNVPGRTVVGLTAESIGRLAAHPHIVAVKEASGSMPLGTAMMEAAAGQLTFLSGDDFTTYPFVAQGGDGCISVVSNLDPKLLHDTVVAAATGDREQGIALHRKVCRLAKLAFCAPNPAPTKWMLQQLDVCRGVLRLPLVPLAESLQATVRDGLAAEGYLS